jgi:hypothetical protein
MVRGSSSQYHPAKLFSVFMHPPQFPRDDLSRMVPEVAPITTDRRELVERVLQHYIAPPEHLREVHQIVTQASLNTNYLVQTSSGNYVLKCRQGAGADHAIARECTLLSLLAAGGVRVPRLVPSRSGPPSVEHAGASWLLTAHVSGQHFVGDSRQLEAVAAELGALVRALVGVTLDHAAEVESSGQFLVELPDLLYRVEHGVASPLRALVREHTEAIRDAQDAVVSARSALETPCGLVHVDLHPMNVLLHENELASVLDMEDVIHYPLVPAIGFDGYKLIRRAVSEPSIGAAQGKELAQRWTTACRQALPELDLDARSLGVGARYRELSRVAYLLRVHLEHGAFADGVEASKHLGAFAELDWLFPC